MNEIILKLNGGTFSLSVDAGGGSVSSNLHYSTLEEFLDAAGDDPGNPVSGQFDFGRYEGAIDALESIILAAHQAGFDVQAESFITAIQTTLDAIGNNLWTPACPSEPSFFEEQVMSNCTAVANGSEPIQQQAAADANAVQDACNLVAVVGCFHRHLLALHRSGIFGDDLINHPVSLSFVSKLNSLCRMTTEREMAALRAINQIEKGASVQCEVIPL